MRLLASLVFVGFSVPIAAAADKDEYKAREAAIAYLKALRAKKLDSLMQTVGTPYLEDIKGQIKLFKTSDELKTHLQAKLEALKDPSKLPDTVSEIHDLPAIRKMAVGKKGAQELQQIEKVLGKKGYVVILGEPGDESGAVLVRVVDGKALVVGIPR
jgi:hypothetical protein